MTSPQARATCTTRGGGERALDVRLTHSVHDRIDPQGHLVPERYDVLEIPNSDGLGGLLRCSVTYGGRTYSFTSDTL